MPNYPHVFCLFVCLFVCFHLFYIGSYLPRISYYIRALTHGWAGEGGRRAGVRIGRADRAHRAGRSDMYLVVFGTRSTGS
jgi:hypothetical protein